jgi:hypothetical protein
VSLIAPSDPDHSSCRYSGRSQCRSTDVWKGRSVERDNMRFHSNATKDYSLYALLLTVPPPWGSHLSRRPKISHARMQSKENMTAKRDRTERKERKKQTRSSPVPFPFFPSRGSRGIVKIQTWRSLVPERRDVQSRCCLLRLVSGCIGGFWCGPGRWCVGNAVVGLHWRVR